MAKLDPTVSAHYVGDCRKLLRQLPDGCVQTCVTSPPYWGLRDYDHGGQIGLEPTPKAYVETLVKVFEQVRRVLRADGTLWLNLGDCYASGGRPEHERRQFRLSGTKGLYPKNPRKGPGHNDAPNRRRQGGLKHKDLVGIPWMVAFALRDAGWYLRMDNIWSKPNPMPESVTDRPTKSHEYLFLLSKSAAYYYNADATREPQQTLGERHEGKSGYRDGHPSKEGRTANMRTLHPLGANKRSVWEVPASVDLAFAREQAQAWAAMVADLEAPPGRPSVWTVTPVPYHGAHFATFPPDLIEPCILAGSRPGDLVLDPFFGSGTTGEVAEKHERLWIGFDIQPKYADLARQRTAQRSLPLARSSK